MHAGSDNLRYLCCAMRVDASDSDNPTECTPPPRVYCFRHTRRGVVLLDRDGLLERESLSSCEAIVLFISLCDAHDIVTENLLKEVKIRRLYTPPHSQSDLRQLMQTYKVLSSSLALFASVYSWGETHADVC